MFSSKFSKFAFSRANIYLPITALAVSPVVIKNVQNENDDEKVKAQKNLILNHSLLQKQKIEEIGLKKFLRRFDSAYSGWGDVFILFSFSYFF